MMLPLILTIMATAAVCGVSMAVVNDSERWAVLGLAASAVFYAGAIVEMIL